jgi:hypothetical protein
MALTLSVEPIAPSPSWSMPLPPAFSVTGAPLEHDTFGPTERGRPL